MAGETVITVCGNLTADPELRYTQNGLPVANFTIASTPRTFDRQANEWKDGDALFLRASVWRDYAENVANSLTKGMRVVAQGVLRMRNYEDREGNKRTSTELEIVEIGPSLRYATAAVQRIQRDSSMTRQQPPPEDAWATPAQDGGPTTADGQTAPKSAVNEEPWSTPGATPDAWSTPGSFGDDTPF